MYLLWLWHLCLFLLDFGISGPEETSLLVEISGEENKGICMQREKELVFLWFLWYCWREEDAAGMGEALIIGRTMNGAWLARCAARRLLHG